MLICGLEHVYVCVHVRDQLYVWAAATESTGKSRPGDSWTGGGAKGGVWFCTGSHGFSLTRVLH